MPVGTPSSLSHPAVQVQPLPLSSPALQIAPPSLPASGCQGQDQAWSLGVMSLPPRASHCIHPHPQWLGRDGCLRICPSASLRPQRERTAHPCHRPCQSLLSTPLTKFAEGLIVPAAHTTRAREEPKHFILLRVQLLLLSIAKSLALGISATF